MHDNLIDSLAPDLLLATAGGGTTAALCRMTAKQFLRFGKRQVMYLKAHSHNGEAAFTLHGADGTPYVIVDAIETAVAIVAALGLNCVAVH